MWPSFLASPVVLSPGDGEEQRGKSDQECGDAEAVRRERTCSIARCVHVSIIARAPDAPRICYEHAFVTAQGSPLTRLRRALAGGDLLAARTHRAWELALADARLTVP